ncbi:hypothetical protein GCM10023194_74200 [Planotetraspora phitsanulokensis]|uniref:Uncharacterized protein n=1 Tax=Planotetraspora phitsanulokensis TaxID=575192 RepID=A0A8J3UDK6_9ACTN|nr:hypothetical protein Pph01_20830 [Planotetraspora phitsanulokensis]
MVRRLSWRWAICETHCICVMTVYELMSYGGIYRLRRTTERRDGHAVSYAGGWRRFIEAGYSAGLTP